jgi:hypothetical protein
VQRQELVEPGQQRAARKVRGGRHAQGADELAAVGRDQRLAFVQQLEGANGVVEQRLALGGQAHGAGRSLEQPRAQLCFQPLERGAGGSGRHAQGVGGCRQGAAARGLHQHLQVREIFNFHLKVLLQQAVLSISICHPTVEPSFKKGPST